MSHVEESQFEMEISSFLWHSNEFKPFPHIENSNQRENLSERGPGPAEALRQRRLLPQWFFPVKIRFFEIKK